jgi:ribulose-5-phosphate 4-epimerase/fuculose-1-phosphate aldolase
VTDVGQAAGQDGDGPLGGLAAWAPRVVPPIGVDLTPEQALACAFRHLDDVGFCENLTGHITWQLPGRTEMLVNPWGLWWAEVTASDICTVDEDARVVAGRWDVTPAIHIHTELHRRRPDARVVVHNHPMYGSILAGLGVLPEIVHQNSSMFHDELVLVDEYSGEVDAASLGADLADLIGDASVAVLVSHGVIVTAPTIEEAVYKSASFERCCEIAYRTMLTGRTPRPIGEPFQKQLKASLLERAAPVYWAGAVRRLVACEPEVLT